jgi:Uma2 family endonuclease
MTAVAPRDILISNHVSLLLESVSWETYESLLRDFDANNEHFRVTYDRGRMVIVSPLPKHEKWKSLLGSFVEAIADARDIPISTYGQTTWKRQDVARGLEPDECFYIQHEPQMRGKLDIELGQDPPPDLAIEIDVRRAPLDRLAIYAALGVPEIWSYDGGHIETLVLQPDNTYQSRIASAAFPFLEPDDLCQFLDRFGTTDQNTLLRALRSWAKTLPTTQ